MKSSSLIRIVVSVVWIPINLIGVHALAVKKPKSQKRISTATSNRGFGPPPLTFDQVISQFPTRIPSGQGEICPCRRSRRQGSNSPDSLLLYRDCCQPYHLGHVLPESPQRVLRTRYSAFCYRIIPYIIQTMHPSSPEYRQDKIEWAKNLHKNGGMFDGYEFRGLEIINNLHDSQQPEEGQELEESCIEFCVHLIPPNGPPGQQEMVLREISKFAKIQNDQNQTSWFYIQGQVHKE